MTDDPTTKRRPIRVEVSAVADPDGNRGVLLQFPDGWMVLTPDNARTVADMLHDVADEVEAR